MTFNTVRLKGGLFDGLEHRVYVGQGFVLVQHLLTRQQWKALRIDDMREWRAPDEVYVREIFMEADGTRRIEYIFKETLHYKPE